MSKLRGVKEELTTSPINRVKFLCSHGGKILPRPPHGQLKYVGGDNRVVVVPRNINYSELMHKLSSLCEGDFILKYQLIPRDFETLVSVKSDNDLCHMFDEYERQERKYMDNGGTPKFKSFLFSSNSSNMILDSSHIYSSDISSYSLEQRYIDAVNGVVRNKMINPSMSPISSSNSSPISSPNDSNYTRLHPNFDRVHSSPNLLNFWPQQNHCHHHHHHHSRPNARIPFNNGYATGRTDIDRCLMNSVGKVCYSPSTPPKNGIRHMGCCFGCRKADK